jgi:hypothetical protein
VPVAPGCLARLDRRAKKALSELSEIKKTKRKAPSLTSGVTDEQLSRWIKFHDVFDRLETGLSEVVEDHGDLDEVFRDAIFQDNTGQLNMCLAPAMKAVPRKLARMKSRGGSPGGPK